MKTLNREVLEINKSLEFVRKSLLPIFCTLSFSYVDVSEEVKKQSEGMNYAT